MGKIKLFGFRASTQPTTNHHDINKLGIMLDQVVSLGAIKREQCSNQR